MSPGPLAITMGIVIAFINVAVVLGLLGQPLIGEYYSQKIIDWWAWSHFGHGIFFCAVAKAIWPHESVWWLVLVVIWAEGAWEVAENTKLVIGMFRDRGDVLYNGDSIVNSMVDMSCCLIGCLITALMLKESVPCGT